MTAGPRADPVLMNATGGTPEKMFRVGRPHLDGDVVRSSIVTGRWMHDGAGLPSAGALAVLLDDALGLAALLRRPLDQWSVTTELSFEVCADLPDDGRELHAEGRLVSEDATGGLAEGRVLDGTGRVLAVATARGRYVPGVPERPPTAPPLAEDDLRAIPELLGASVSIGADGPQVNLAASQELNNPRGVVHGGLATAASELAGSLALHADGGPHLRTSSVRIAFLRPTPAGVRLCYSTRVIHRGRSLGVAHVIGGPEGGPACTVATVTGQAPPA